MSELRPYRINYIDNLTFGFENLKYIFVLVFEFIQTFYLNEKCMNF